ncbi:MAG: hypothetical protein NC548_49235 [Lachnospiraceae bacterium]|nr:hypothetical protein [Prevotella sp.]MCM1074347.1 hypothetical protein [Ruminococcus sp.]MCM1222481.1 hypothetical protein [Lachnospiraceae bacterium]
MNKQEKIVLISGGAVVLVLIGLLVWLLFFKNGGNAATDNGGDSLTLETDQAARLSEDAWRADSLQMVIDQQNMDRMLLELPTLEQTQNIQPEQQALVDKYNEARNKIENLVAELKSEQANSAKNKQRSQAEIEAQRKKIAELESQVEQLKGYCKDLLGQLAELNEKYNQQVEINSQLTEQNQKLQATVSSTASKNEELTATVNTAKRLIITNVSLKAYNKKDKPEKKIKKAAKLGVSFTVTANNAASAGMKDFYIIIKTPEGQTLTGGGAFQAEGTTLQATARRQIEYANEEVSLSVYYDAGGVSLSEGTYSVMIFCDGTCLKRASFNL